MHSKGRKNYRSMIEVEIDREYDREMHRLWCEAQDARGHVPSEGISDIRRHRQFPWRIEGRRQLEAVLADVDETVFEQMDAARRERRRKIREATRQGLLTIRVVAHRKAA